MIIFNSYVKLPEGNFNGNFDFKLSFHGNLKLNGMWHYYYDFAWDFMEFSWLSVPANFRLIVITRPS